MNKMFSGGNDNNQEKSEDMNTPMQDQYAQDAVANDVPMASKALSDYAPGTRQYETTYFAEGTTMEGTLRAKGDVEIVGDFKGEVISEGKVTVHSSISSNITAADLTSVGSSLTGDVNVSGNVTLTENSVVTGNIKARELVCSGKVKGDLDIQNHMTLDEKAQIIGNIKTGTLSISRGAKITGNISMQGMEEE